MHIKLRFANENDAAVLLEIYKPFVESEDSSVSDVSFEYIAPDVEEFATRIRETIAAFPYLVLEENGVPLGYAYAHPYRARIAYQWSVEVTIYLAPAGQGKGYGRILYSALEELLKRQGVTNLYACITKSNERSIALHRAMGYRINGEFRQCGFKNGHWLDMVWMEKLLQEHPPAPDPIRNIAELDRQSLLDMINENLNKK